MLPEINGVAIPQMDLEFDALVECEANDPLAGPPETWPDCPWVDGDRYELGPALTPDEGVYEPSPADLDWLLDQAERRDYERGCGRFAY